MAGSAAANAGVVREPLPGTALPEAPSVTAVYTTVPSQKGADAFFGKYLSPSLLKPNSRYQPSSSDKLMERATDAASSIFVTRDQSGKRHLNTSYFLRVLTSVAATSASRRYRARSNAAPLSDFGATIGNDAGMNLLHEFGPGLRQAMTSHMPEFVSRIQDRVSREQNPRPPASIPSR
jgi:hypothetical protein